MTSYPPRLTSESPGKPEGEQAQDPCAREEQAKNVCLRLLTVRARTRSELEAQLTKRGYPDDVSARVLDRLTEVGLIDDEDFAEQWVRSRHANAGKGKRALAVELRKKGVDDEVISSALADLDPAAERQRAEQLVRDKLRRERLADDDDVKVTRRLVGMLARRGYSQSMAFDVVSVELASERERRRV
ncbi:recombination regulator RecX [Mycolicibacterium wolinskyi]|uniref:Regulatory protein RecX n=1 Tax=Mycolicibacterium wolinskyi TaxID=59750 RepID=A0A1X2EY15_9MYCO|nr:MULTISPECIES: recombination regulator RecX [Mycolicibacterium]MCV7290033.1 recombination regulator RecX [Mycolicibacterium wolinskyi]MCV7293068.1 recombination regulator RecX [Mycolicibacterium goodii]ORX10669.1 recombinase RecX [Mycolicibacterium wolinskyi]